MAALVPVPTPLSTMSSSSSSEHRAAVCDSEPADTGRHSSARITGVIFDMGKTLTFCSNRDEMAAFIKMASFVANTLTWNTEKERKFLKRFTDYYIDTVKLQKDHVGTWHALDPGFVLEQPMGDVVATVLKEFSVTATTFESLADGSTAEWQAFIDSCVEIMRAPMDCFQLMDGVTEVLESLRDSGVLMAVVSNQSDGHRQLQVLEHLRIAHYFDPVIVSAFVSYRKPDKRILDSLWTHPSWSSLSRDDVVVVGDKRGADVLLAKYSNLKSVLIPFSKPKTVSGFKAGGKLKPRKSALCPFSAFEMHGSHIVESHSFSAETIESLGYLTPDVCIDKITQLPGVLQSLAEMPPKRPLTVGAFIMATKVRKLLKRGLFSMCDYRDDIKLQPIDFSRSLLEQGPFDILLHKLVSWSVVSEEHCALEDVVVVRPQFEDCMRYIEDYCLTNLHLDGTVPMPATELLSAKPKMFVLDRPTDTFLTADRWKLIQMITNASDSLSVTLPTTDSSAVSDECVKYSFTAPKTALIPAMSEATTVEGIVTEAGIGFPMILKARCGVSSVTKDSEKDTSCSAHTFKVLSSMTHLTADTSVCVRSGEDWIVQQFVAHNEEVHKVYVLGRHTFATANDSIPPIDELKLSGEMQFKSGTLSKRMVGDQSAVKGLSRVYTKLSASLKDACGMSCFGYDVIFDETKPDCGYIIDINFLPSYNCVDNLCTLFWAHVLQQYYAFVNAV